jgi:menaquinone-dependent protoporphyrinogen oxidase
MASFLVLYGTGEGQTEKVAIHIGDVLIDRGHEATTVDASEI